MFSLSKLAVFEGTPFLASYLNGLDSLAITKCCAAPNNIYTSQRSQICSADRQYIRLQGKTETNMLSRKNIRTEPHEPCPLWLSVGEFSDCNGYDVLFTCVCP